MPITRQGPVMNMDTEQELVFVAPNQRFTRAQAHRLLKHHGIDHNPGWGMKELMYALEVNDIQPAFIPPGSMIKPEKVINLPNNVPKLRALCKQAGIQFKNTDKMVDLKGFLNG